MVVPVDERDRDGFGDFGNEVGKLDVRLFDYFIVFDVYFENHGDGVVVVSRPLLDCEWVVQFVGALFRLTYSSSMRGFEAMFRPFLDRHF
ncbi:hypothetical protein SAMN04489842_0242 [Natronobacterium texcoconense]|uniref:Uncharacterized protein n=1 Tax=Natronobacterium texcoconense TaxID=1095778 RepID=A0A1H0ZE06_NATTX|nr:hypothetical protein SAMN04489842_0242 [Natronobacterium texcoconense]